MKKETSQIEKYLKNDQLIFNPSTQNYQITENFRKKILDSKIPDNLEKSILKAIEGREEISTNDLIENNDILLTASSLIKNKEFEFNKYDANFLLKNILKEGDLEKIKQNIAENELDKDTACENIKYFEKD